MDIGQNAVIIAATCDMSRSAGDTIRIVSLANCLAIRHVPVRIIVAASSSEKYSLDLEPSIIIEKVGPKFSRGYLSSLRMLVSVALRSLRQRGELQVEGTVLGFLISLAGRKGIWLDIHGLLFDEIRYRSGLLSRTVSRIIYYLERIAVSRAEINIVVSTPMKRYICEEWRCPPHRVVLVPNGYVQRIIDQSREANTEEMSVTYVGQVTGWASLDHILASAKKTATLGAFYRIVGGGLMLDELKRSSIDLGIMNLDFLGFQPIQRVYEIISASEVLVAPLISTLALEVACPIKLLEYIALGKPVVVEDVGEIPSMLKKMGAALVVPSNADALTEGICSLLTDGKARKRLCKMAVRASKGYSWSRQGDRLYRLRMKKAGG